MILSRTQWGVICALLSSILFAIKAILVKQAYAVSADISAMTLLTLRMVIALPFFILILLLLPKMEHKITPKEWVLLVIAGLMGYYASSVLDFMGLMYVSASLERIILFLYPTITVVASAILYKQRILPMTWFAILLSYGGTVLVMLNEPMQQSANHLWLGVALVFGSAITYAIYLMMGQGLVEKFGSMRFTAMATSVAGLGVVLHYGLETPFAINHILNLPNMAYVYGAMLGIFSTVVPTILLMMGVEKLGASRAAMISAGGPIFTIALAALLLDEYLNAWQWLGCALNIIGVLMVSFRKIHK